MKTKLSLWQRFKSLFINTPKQSEPKPYPEDALYRDMYRKGLIDKQGRSIPAPPVPPPNRRIIEGKQPETPQESQKRWDQERRRQDDSESTRSGPFGSSLFGFDDNSSTPARHERDDSPSFGGGHFGGSGAGSSYDDSSSSHSHHSHDHSSSSHDSSSDSSSWSSSDSSDSSSSDSSSSSSDD